MAKTGTDECQPKVSIGLPVYNGHRTLRDAVRSVLMQTHKDWELILADDGSTDGSLELMRQIRDPRVRVLSDGQNRGLVWRLNQIAQEARGKYLARMDADDMMHPERIERQARFLQSHPECDVVGTDAYAFAEGTETWRALPSPGAGRDAHEVPVRGHFNHPTIMGKTEWFRSNPYDAGYGRAEDLELWCRTFSKSRFELMRDPLLLYRIGKSGSGYGRKYRASARTVRRILRRYGPEHMGWPKTLGLMLESHAKSGMMTACDWLGCAERMQANRWPQVRGEELTRLGQILEQIRATPLPLEEGSTVGRER